MELELAYRPTGKQLAFHAGFIEKEAEIWYF